MEFKWKRRSNPTPIENDLSKGNEMIDSIIEYVSKYGHSLCMEMPEYLLLNNNKMENLTDLLKGKVIKNVTHNDAGQVTGIEFKVEKFQPKDGDFVTIKFPLGRCIYIYKSYSISIEGSANSYCGINTNDILDFDHHYGLCGRNVYSCSPATASEKQQLLDALKSDGKCWNAKKKCVERLRWRANIGDPYISFVIGETGRMNAEVMLDHRNFDDNILFSAGNYFSPITATEPILERLNAIFAEQL